MLGVSSAPESDCKITKVKGRMALVKKVFGKDEISLSSSLWIMNLGISVMQKEALYDMWDRQPQRRAEILHLTFKTNLKTTVSLKHIDRLINRVVRGIAKQGMNFGCVR